MERRNLRAKLTGQHISVRAQCSQSYVLARYAGCYFSPLHSSALSRLLQVALAFKEWITPADIRRHPRSIFVFGDNVERRGRGGLAGVCRDQPNAIGVVTKWWLGRREQDFFSDANFKRCFEMILHDLKKVEEVLAYGGEVIFPTAPLGSGLSKMPERCPRLYEAMKEVVRVFPQRYGGMPSPW